MQTSSHSGEAASSGGSDVGGTVGTMHIRQ
jgi:hypothetical protein